MEGVIERWRSLADYYLKTARMAVIRDMQYRFTHVLDMVGFLFEPIVYLVIWQQVARANGGEVAGYPAEALPAYYLMWTLVRSMNLAHTPYGFEWRIQRGEYNKLLLLPIHPIHHDLAWYAGAKVFLLIRWIPVAAVFVLTFEPTMHVTVGKVAVFCLSVVGAYLVRSMYQWTLGLVTFWSTRVTALFGLSLVAELLLSGRLAPMSVLPQGLRTVAEWLPFQWTLGFPIEVMVGELSRQELLRGLLMQAVWTLLGAAAATALWKRAVRRYTAVGA